MLFNIIAPEWPLGKAVSDLRSVRSTKRKFKALKDAKKVSCSWSTQNMHFANKGGFALRFSESNIAPREGPQTSTTVAKQLENAWNGRDPTACAKSGIWKSLLWPKIALLSALDDIELANPEISSTLAAPDDSGSAGAGQTGLLPADTHEPLTWIPRHPWKLLRPFRPAISPELLQQRTDQKSCNIGPIKWALNTTNNERVNIALKTVKPDIFRNPWEEKRFQYMPKQWIQNLAPLAGDLWVLDANQLLYAWNVGIIGELPNIPEDDLEDRNKGDLVVKFMAILQVLWFMAQFFSRLKMELPITQLEILTFSYAVCTPITYCLLLSQPKDVQYSLPILAKRYATPQELIRLAVIGPTDVGLPRTSIWIPNTCIHATLDGGSFATINYLAGAASGALLVLGGLHCIAWTYEFPSKGEQFYWKVASLLTAFIFPTWYAVQWFLSIATVKIKQKIDSRAGARENPDETKNRSGISAQFRVRQTKDITLMLVFYFVVVRLYIIFEVIRTLAFQPPEAFSTSTWWANVPHIG